MQKSHPSAGFCGKLPFMGDFVERRLPREFVDSWDEWLEQAIATSQKQLESEKWNDFYDATPIWRFALSADICGSKAIAGIFRPSRDKVGRTYPLTVAVLIEQDHHLPFLFTKGNHWFELIEDVVLQALEESSDIDTFDKHIQSIPPFSTTELSKSFLPKETIAFYTSLPASEKIDTAFMELTASFLAHLIPNYSIWTTEGDNKTQAVLFVCNGLPVADFSIFLNTKTSRQTNLIKQETGAYNPSNEIGEIKQPAPVEVNQQTTIADEVDTEMGSLSNILAANKIFVPVTSWQSWSATDVGKRRKYNEDSLLNKPESGIWVVADGMGGYEAGDVASQLIVNRVNELPATELLNSYVASVKSCLEDINIELRNFAREKYANSLVGSTVVALLCSSSQCAFLWAGDSRLYRLRDNQLQQLTTDHCEVNQHDESAVKSNNAITRAVGADDTLELDIEIMDVTEGDIFLLCSDGVDKELSFKEIEQIMQNCEKSAIADTLMREILNRDARDNVSIIVVAAENVL